VLVLVLGMSFLLLTVVFRSIVVAFKAILMNLLSVGAAYGLLVLVFQEGVGAGVARLPPGRVHRRLAARSRQLPGLRRTRQRRGSDRRE
jgi:uncharacterized membrane protein YdfJ with MMPL/SSD domain